MAARLGLRLASWPYQFGVRCRNASFDRGWKAIHRAPVPIVSIGNLTLGGTGKTPCVEYVSSYYREHGIRVAILSRGYGAQGVRNDEAMILEENLPDVPHLQDPDRVSAAHRAVEELESELLVLDDGFQHRHLHRDLDAGPAIVTRHVLDAGRLARPAERQVADADDGDWHTMDRLPVPVETGVAATYSELVWPARQAQAQPGGHRERPPSLTPNNGEPGLFHGGSGLPLGIEAGESSRSERNVSTAAISPLAPGGPVEKPTYTEARIPEKTRLDVQLATLSD